ncbi:PorH family porin [Corynebacterium callunae]|uniref:PorH family porin n=1 Tax=Corynebacterium callunae TaxID=1721 RepID=UPI00200058A5|nr:PorH family porin [Corynebacterium callunae]MCK2200001.1 PorH family porin [Corynebacterium callunae]
MDLSLLADSLDDYSTFGGNIGDVLVGIPNLLKAVITFFDTFGTNADATSAAFDGLSS